MARDYQTKSNVGALPDTITATRFGAGEFNSIAVELENAVTSSDQTLAPADGTGEVTDQLAMALAIYGAGGAFYHADTGAVNAYVLTPISPKQSPPAYFDGFTVIFEPGTPNTTASTVNVATLGVKDITYVDGNPLTGGELSGSCGIKYNLSDDRFELLFSSGSLAGIEVAYIVDASQADQGAASANADTLTLFDIAALVGTTKSATCYLIHNPVAGSVTNFVFDTSLDLSTYPNLYLKMSQGTRFTQNTGDEVLTLYSSENLLISDQQTITSVDMLAFSIESRVIPNWWGAVADDSTDCTNAITYADTTAAASGGYVEFLPGIHVISSLTKTAQWRGAGLDVTTIKREDSAATGILITTSETEVKISDMTIDGNKANQTNGGNNFYVFTGTDTIRMLRVRITGAYASGGYGAGLNVIDSALNGSSYIKNCIVDSNDANGAAIENAYDLTISESSFFSNGANGAAVDNYDQTFTQKLVNIRIVNNNFDSNTDNGLVVSNYVENNDSADPTYGHDDLEASQVIVSNNIARANGAYGLAIGGYAIQVSGNISRNNCQTSSTAAGVLFTAFFSNLNNNVIEENQGYGIDAGGCAGCLISNNVINNNINGGINLEANENVLVSNNSLFANGNSSGGYQINLDRFGGASVTQGFEQDSTGIIISENKIKLDGTRIGIICKNNPANTLLFGNKFFCLTLATDLPNCVLAIGNGIRINKNVLVNQDALGLTVSGGGVLEIPDILETGYTNSATTIDTLWTTSMATVADGVAYCSITAVGSGFTSQPTVTIAGDGAGATAIALVNVTTGELTGIRMTAYGSGYTAATVTISGGGGSGATATATVGLKPPQAKEISIYFLQAETITRAGTVVVENPPAADIAVPIRGFIKLRGLFSGWYLENKNF